MPDDKQREIANSLFKHNQRRETQRADILKQEKSRHEATVKNVHRLRELAHGQASA